MKKKEFIKISITGEIDKQKLTPDNFDIAELKELLDNFEKIIAPDNKIKRPVIGYRIEEGSIINKFIMPLVAVAAFNGILEELDVSKTLDFLPYRQAKSFEAIQLKSQKNNWDFNISTSLKQSHKLRISKDTNFLINPALWVTTEVYLYGDIIEAGGKQNPNIHIDTKEYGTIIVSVSREVLKEKEQNLLYKTIGLKAQGLQNINTGKLENLSFIEFVDYSPVYDEKYMQECVEKATPAWADVKDVDKWINELRGVA